MVAKYDWIDASTCYIMFMWLKWTRKQGYTLVQVKIFILLSHELIGRWNVVQGVALSVSFYDPPCKENLLTNHKHKCFPFPSGTSSSSSNASHVFTWITREVKEYNMIHFGKVDPSRCPAINFKSIKLFVTKCESSVSQWQVYSKTRRINAQVTTKVPISANQKQRDFFRVRIEELLQIC